LCVKGNAYLVELKGCRCDCVVVHKLGLELLHGLATSLSAEDEALEALADGHLSTRKENIKTGESLGNKV
jgi:hypothetical protein